MTLALLGPLLLALFGGHAVADYGLQSAYVAEFKVRSERNPDWFVTLGAHCLIHAFMVLITTGSAILAGRLLNGDSMAHAAMMAAAGASALGWLEFACHFAIDDAKGQKRFSYRVDQALHYACKIVWLGVCAIYIS